MHRKRDQKTWRWLENPKGAWVVVIEEGLWMGKGGEEREEEEEEEKKVNTLVSSKGMRKFIFSWIVAVDDVTCCRS